MSRSCFKKHRPAEKKIKPTDNTRDMGLKTYKGQDNEGYIHGSKQEGFNERRAQERQRQEDRNELNREDVRGTVKGNERL